MPCYTKVSVWSGSPYVYMHWRDKGTCFRSVTAVRWLRLGLPQVAPVVKNPSANAGGASSIPGLGRCLGEGNGNPLQYSCLGNLMDRGAWRATVHRVTKNQTWLSTHAESSSLQTVSSGVAWDTGGSRLPTSTLSPTALLDIFYTMDFRVSRTKLEVIWRQIPYF